MNDYIYVGGIDPSYTNTGLALLRVTSGQVNPTIEVVERFSFKAFNPQRSRNNRKNDVYELENTVFAASHVASVVKGTFTTWAEKWEIDLNSTIPSLSLFVEYPALATPSGAYLGFIQQALYDAFSSWGVNVPLYAFPPVAINSHTHTKTKTELVEWVKSNVAFTCPIKRKGSEGALNHDEASAVVLALLGQQVLSFSYGKSYKCYVESISI